MASRAPCWPNGSFGHIAAPRLTNLSGSRQPEAVTGRQRCMECNKATGHGSSWRMTCTKAGLKSCASSWASGFFRALYPIGREAKARWQELGYNDWSLRRGAATPWREKVANLPARVRLAASPDVDHGTVQASTAINEGTSADSSLARKPRGPMRAASLSAARACNATRRPALLDRCAARHEAGNQASEYVSGA